MLGPDRVPDEHPLVAGVDGGQVAGGSAAGESAVLPDRPPSDSDEAWGDQSPADGDDLARLIAERPPHYE